MTNVAEKYDYVIGVDTHARTHTYAIINTRTGARTGCEAFPVSGPGMGRAIAWIRRNTTNEIIAAVEGTKSYGASICRKFTEAGITITEVKPPRKQARAGIGKTDEIDATAAAMSVLGTEIELLLQPRTDGIRTAMNLLLTRRRRIEQQCTANRNALNALVRQTDLGLDARRALTDQQITEISAWRSRRNDGIEQCIARQEASELANDILSASARLKSNKAQLAELSEQIAPGFQEQPGLGPVTTGIILASYSHHGRFRSEAAFASLAGAAPLQASSGNVTRHRLNRHGDRQLNMALDIVIKNRMIHDQTTKEYAERRTAEGLSYREIKRVLKRYLARSIFRQLEKIFTLT